MIWYIKTTDTIIPSKDPGVCFLLLAVYSGIHLPDSASSNTLILAQPTASASRYYVRIAPSTDSTSPVT
jgi:hypothetical protein